MKLSDAKGLLPQQIADLRGLAFVEIVWEETHNDPDLKFLWKQESDAFVVRAIGAFAPQVAPFTSRLTLQQRRQFLTELPELCRLAGTVYSLKRSLELFGYTVQLVENTNGTFEVRVAQTVLTEEIRAIVDKFAPLGRICTSIRGMTAILLDGSRLFDGSTTLAG